MNEKTLLLEIGAEEIPAGYIQPALDALKAGIAKGFSDARITHGEVRVFGTPRRLAILVEAVAPRQSSVSATLMGPPESVAFDKAGAPTMAAVKFAEKARVPVHRLSVQDTAKGRYVCAKKTDRGQATQTLLKSLLPQLVLSIPFPKTMRWADLPIAFARPILHIVALFGEKIIPFAVGNVKSGRHSQGHRFMSPGKLKIDAPENYTSILTGAQVEPDIDVRRERIRNQVAEEAARHAGSVLPDAGLLDIVCQLVEQPYPVVGRFEDKFLALPREILITAMREHQKYFAVADGEGRLMPLFVAVNNTLASDMSLVQKGHERVIRARLSDASFFYNSDVKKSMDDWVVKLKGVLFQAKLGSMYDKVRRVVRIAETLAAEVGQAAGLPDSEGFVRKAGRAAHLCKADLVSEVVGEFPNLQGVMGRVYAGVAGEAEEVAAAIEEHYRPTHSGGQLPETLLGAVVSIADKIDSICGCFSADLLPTGASDPYALRRQAIGIVQIMLDRKFFFSIKKAIVDALSGFTGAPSDTGEKVYRFIESRIEQMLVDQGVSRDVVTAVTSVSIDPVPHVWARVRSLEALKSEPDFDPLVTAFKRVVNIIRKAGESAVGEVDPSRFVEKSEHALYEAYLSVEKMAEADLSVGRFDAALHGIAGLKPAVDGFFDDVMVMSDDAGLRANRLSLLGKISRLFDRFADFTKLAV